MRPATVAFACLLTPAAGAWADEPPARPATAPLAPAAFVSRPPALRGVAAWTIETVGDDYPSFGRPVYSPDGKRVAVPGQHGVVRVWDVGGRRLTRVLYPSRRGYKPGVVRVAWSADGKRLAGFVRFGVYDNGSDTGLTIWDVDAGRELHDFRLTLSNYASGLAWCPIQPVIAVASSFSGRVTFLDSRTGAEVGSVSGPEPRPGRLGAERWEPDSLAWSPDGASFAVVAGRPERRVVEVWDYGRKAVRFTRPAGGAGLELDVQPTWSPDGRRLAFRTSLTDVEVVDAGDQARVAGVKLATHSRGEVRFDWTADGRELDGVAAGDGYYDGRTGRRVHRDWDVGYAGLAWGPDDKSVAFRGTDWGLLDLTTKQAARWESPVVGFCAAWSADGRRLVTAARRQSEGFFVWDAGSLRLERPLVVPTESPADGVRAVWAAGPGKMLHVTEAGTVTCWDVADGRVAWAKAEFTDPRDRLTVSAAHGLVFALTKMDAGKAEVAVLDPRTGKAFKTFSTNETYHLTVAPGGLRVAAGRGETFQMWDVLTGKPVDVPGALRGRPNLPAWSPDGRRVVLEDRVFDTATWKEAARLEKPWYTPFAPCHWSPDGKLLTHEWGKVWEASTGRLLLDEHCSYPVFAPDGRRLVCPGRGGYAVWDAGERRWEAHLFRLGKDKGLCISAGGHYAGLSPAEAGRHLVYVVQSDRAQEVLSPVEFETKFGWKNDPAQVRPGGK